jgi:ribosomal protein L21E
MSALVLNDWGNIEYPVDSSVPHKFTRRQDGRLANISDFHNGRRVDITMNYSFRHLDPSVIKTYQGTVLYGFESHNICFLIKVKKGYVIETPEIQNSKWIRGQHLSVLKDYFKSMTPIRILSDAY